MTKERLPHLGVNASFSIDRLNEDHSARTWLRKGGHAVSLADARLVALNELAEAEARLQVKDQLLATAETVFKQAERERTAMHNQRQLARFELKRAQEHLAWVCSTDAPE